MKPFPTTGLAALLLLAFAFPLPLRAWNKPTHMVIGAIAYRELKQASPKALAEVVALLKEHPEYGKWVAGFDKYHVPKSERDERLLMEACRWPDDTRGSSYDHPTWHYINYRYQPSDSVRRDSVLATGENIIQAYNANLTILKSDASNSSKAIALCWVMHLIGDVHQPLHTTTLVSEQFPEGDRGGNLFQIKVGEDSKTINLHTLWDGLLLGSDRPQDAGKVASQLLRDMSRGGLPNHPKGDFEQWAKESADLARESVYLNGQLSATTDKENGAVLPKAYAKAAKSVAEEQVALASYRLADVLAAL
jgi:hypothetical protein